MNDTFDILKELVRKATCKPGWRFRIVDEEGALRLVITVPGVDSYNPENPLTVNHLFPVPIATYNGQTWQRWIFERCRGVENHELGEWFKIDGMRPFAPLHGPGEDPYTVHEFRDDVDRRTIQDGTVVEKLGAVVCPGCGHYAHRKNACKGGMGDYCECIVDESKS